MEAETAAEHAVPALPVRHDGDPRQECGDVVTPSHCYLLRISLYFGTFGEFDQKGFDNIFQFIFVARFIKNWKMTWVSMDYILK